MLIQCCVRQFPFSGVLLHDCTTDLTSGLGVASICAEFGGVQQI